MITGDDAVDVKVAIAVIICGDRGLPEMIINLIEQQRNDFFGRQFRDVNK